MKYADSLKMKNLIIFIVMVSVLFTVNYLFKYPLAAGPRVLYLDDLNTYYGIRDGNLIDAMFQMGANKIRPVTNGIIYAAFQMAGTDLKRLDILILFWNVAVAAGITGITFWSLNQALNVYVKAAVASVAGILYSISRFSYYVWTEIIGLMESTSLILAVCMLFLLVRYLNDEKEKCLRIVNVLYFIVIFTHERYILLAGVILAAVFLKHGFHRPFTYIPSIAIAVSFFVMRIVLFGNRFVDGTGGTSILDTFDLGFTVKCMASQIFYILGINMGPAYLNGIEWRGVPFKINICIMLQIVLIIACLCSYLALALKKRDMAQLKISALYLVFIACCIVSSSVTIRVEMRWIYVSYTAFLIYMAQAVSYLLAHVKMKELFLAGVVYLGLGFICENYYQSFYGNLYYWGTRSLIGSMYEQTIYKYGEDVFQKDIYVIGTSIEWTEEVLERHFSPFYKEKKEFPKVVNAGSIEEAVDAIPPADDSVIVLLEIPGGKYADISENVKAGNGNG